MRSAVEKVMWVGRGVVFLVGLVTILVLAFVLVNALLGVTGGPSLFGQFNQIDPGARRVTGEQALVVEPVARRRQIEIPRAMLMSPSQAISTPTFLRRVSMTSWSPKANPPITAST
jgi:hypothetical protein